MEFKGIEKEQELGNLNEFEYRKYVDFHRETMEIPAFQIEGRTFVGNRSFLIRKYVKQNPSDKFIVWLINQGITEIKK